MVLATDGDFNVGVTSQDALVRLIERERQSGVFLSVLGVGTGNLKDSTMEQLADKGNGNYAYLDSLHEARKVLVRELGGTLDTIAKDVKIQVEFNPLSVDGYRLIGYENRVMANEDFNDDTKDAGDIGAGHSVTALYEIVPKGTRTPGTPRSDLKYQREPRIAPAARGDELLTVAVRFKQPDADESRRVSATMIRSPRPMTANLGFASAVAEFGMLLRGSPHAGRASYGSVIERARRYAGDDRDGYRAEFIAHGRARGGAGRSAAAPRESVTSGRDGAGLRARARPAAGPGLIYLRSAPVANPHDSYWPLPRHQRRNRMRRGPSRGRPHQRPPGGQGRPAHHYAVRHR